MRTTAVARLALAHDTETLLLAGAARVAATILANNGGNITANALHEYCDRFRMLVLSAAAEASDSAPARRMVRRAARG